MLRDITIGQHYPADSWVHRLDPRTKLMISMLYLVSLFTLKAYVSFVLVTCFLLTTIYVSKVPLKYILRGLKPIMFFIIFAFLLNALMTPGEILFKLGFLKVTYQGLERAFFMAGRLVLLILGTSMLTLTTAPIQLTDGIESLLNPFKRIGVPAHELAMMMTIALRFIPTLLVETDKIMKAQMARGADFESRNLMSRAKSLVPLLVPLFISAFRRADELAMAMEARCYRGGNNRTRMKPIKHTKKDFIAYGIFLIYIVGLVVLEMNFR